MSSLRRPVSLLGSYLNSLYRQEGTVISQDVPTDIRKKYARLESDEGVDSLAGKLVGGTNDSGLGNTRVLDQSRLDFSGTQTVTRDVDDIVNTTLDPDVAVLVPSSTIAGEVEAGVRAHISFEVTLVVAPDGTSDRGPWISESQNTLNAVAFKLLAGGSVENDGVDTPEGDGGGTGLGGDSTGEWSDDDRAGLGLPLQGHQVRV